MKVNLEIVSIEDDGSRSKTETKAIMELRQYDFRILYAEKLSDDGKLTAQAELLIAPTGLRMIRKGAIESDFFYEENLKHNTLYQTPYGAMPITVETYKYDYRTIGGGLAGLSDEFEICVGFKYKMYISNEKPLDMEVIIKITNI